MGSEPEPQWGLGRSPSGGSGGRAPSHILAAKPPRGLGGLGRDSQLPAYMIQSSLPVWSAARSQICLNPVWRVGCEDSRSEPERSEGERSDAEDRSPPSQTGFREIWRRSGDTKSVA